MNRHRELAQMMRAAAGPPPVSPLPWVHKWDFTNVSGSTVPDIVSSVDLTLTGSYTANSSGVTPTAASCCAEVLFTSLDVDLTRYGDDFSLILTCSNIDSSGENNTFGRFFDTYVSSSNQGIRMYLSNSVTSVSYNKGFEVDTFSVANVTNASSISAVADSSKRARVLVDETVYWPGSLDAISYCNGTSLNLMNRGGHDRAMDGTCTGAGILSRALTDAEALEAEAELLAL